MGHGDHSLDSDEPSRLSNFRIYGIRWYRRGGIWCCTVRSNVNRCTVGVYRDDSWSADAALPDDVREHAFAMRPARDCLCGRHTLTVHPKEPWNAEVRERCMALGPTDVTPRHDKMEHYSSQCSCCYLNITHTQALHAARLGNSGT